MSALEQAQLAFLRLAVTYLQQMIKELVGNARYCSFSVFFRFKRDRERIDLGEGYSLRKEIDLEVPVRLAFHLWALNV